MNPQLSKLSYFETKMWLDKLFSEAPPTDRRQRKPKIMKASASKLRPKGGKVTQGYRDWCR